jgi:squalene-associated FAD-dependent desaturase
MRHHGGNYVITKHQTSSPRAKVIVIGGGLAGLAAASALARRELAVTLLESRPRLGGRASSFVDRETGEVIDNCQHVAMQCCRNFAQFARELDFEDCFKLERELLFIGPPDRTSNRDQPKQTTNNVRSSRFYSACLPAPAHLAFALARQSWLSWKEKFRIALAMRKLSRYRVEHDEPFLDWLKRNKQSENAQRCFWHVVLVSALSETLDRVSLKHARKVFVDGFLTNRHGWEVLIPTVPLNEIYESRIRIGLERWGVDLRLKAGVDEVVFSDQRASGVKLRTGEILEADFVVLAVPQNLMTSIIPQFANEPEMVAVSEIETAPIASVHLWFDQEITDVAHAVFVDRLSHWVFNRSDAGEHDAGSRDASNEDRDSRRWYYQVVISAARELSGMSEAEVLDRVEAELKEVWPDGGSAQRIHGRLITEHNAVFAPVPGIDDKRLDQSTDIANVMLAGDWTQTGWPATMEGAVRSGYLAAEKVMTSLERPDNILAQPLPKSLLFRLLYER